MIPIHELLNRIRWDERYRAARFDIGYYDRIDGAIHIVPLSALRFPTDEKAAFTFIDDEGIARHVPLHRIKVVYRDGERVWARRH